MILTTDNAPNDEIACDMEDAGHVLFQSSDRSEMIAAINSLESRLGQFYDQSTQEWRDTMETMIRQLKDEVGRL